MRGVEGAGAYRIGHPLGVENERPQFRFQTFLRNMANHLPPAKCLMKLPYPASEPAGGLRPPKNSCVSAPIFSTRAKAVVAEPAGMRRKKR